LLVHANVDLRTDDQNHERAQFEIRGRYRAPDTPEATAAG
jgi:hypothetical protein